MAHVRSASTGKQDMSAVDMDYMDLTALARGDGSAGGWKRGLTRGDSDAKPPMAKARSEALRQAVETPVPKDTEETENPMMALLQQLVTKVDGIGRAVDELAQVKEEVKDIKSKVEHVQIDVGNMRTSIMGATTDAVRALEAAQEAKEGITALQEQVNALKLAEAGWTEMGYADKHWPRLGEGVGKGGAASPSKGEGKGFPQATTAKTWPGQDQLIVGGFPPGSNRAVREQGAKMVLAALPSVRPYFENPTAVYESGRVCHITKRADAPWSMLRRALEAYKESGEIEVIIEGKKWKLWLGLNKSPQRRKRNALLRRLERRAAEKGAQDLSIDWWGGHLLSKNLRLVSVADDSEIRFIPNPWLEALDTTRWLQEEERIFRSKWEWNDQA